MIFLLVACDPTHTHRTLDSTDLIRAHGRTREHQPHTNADKKQGRKAVPCRAMPFAVCPLKITHSRAQTGDTCLNTTTGVRLASRLFCIPQSEPAWRRVREVERAGDEELHQNALCESNYRIENALQSDWAHTRRPFVRPKDV